MRTVRDLIEGTTTGDTGKRIAAIAKMVYANDHGGAMQAAAELVGDRKMSERFKLINRLHELDGSLDSDLGKYRYGLYMQLKKIAEKKLEAADFDALMAAM